MMGRQTPLPRTFIFRPEKLGNGKPAKATGAGVSRGDVLRRIDDEAEAGRIDVYMGWKNLVVAKT
jgi:hypothetical protein